MGLCYMLEKFDAGIRCLTLGLGPINERVLDAFVPHIASIVPDRDVPPDLLPDFEKLMSMVHKYPPRWAGEGLIHATVMRIRRRTAREIAEEILWLRQVIKDRLDEERGRRAASPPLSGGCTVP